MGFKGGTCLSKVHSDFYRMSEDLDFAFSVPLDASRSQRSKMIVPMKEHLAKLARRLACFNVVEALRGYNNSTQYIGSLSYKSVVTGQDESIKVEFSIREPILEPVEPLTSPRRPRAVWAETACTTCGSRRAWAVKSVTVRPGAMAFTVMPRLPKSAARITVKRLMAALVIE